MTDETMTMEPESNGHPDEHDRPGALTPAQFRTLVRDVIRPMEVSERLHFLATAPAIISYSLRDQRSNLGLLERLVEVTEGVRTVKAVSQYLRGLATLQPVWSDLSPSKAKECMEVVAEAEEAARSRKR